EKGAPYPQVILPQFGGYWIEDPEAPPPPPAPPAEGEDEDVEDGGGGGQREAEDFGYRLEEMNQAARAYRKHFLGKEHLNFCCSAGALGNLLLSVRHEEEKEEEHLHVIVRSRVKTGAEPRSVLMGPLLLPLQLLCDEAAGLRFSPVLYPKVSRRPPESTVKHTHSVCFSPSTRQSVPIVIAGL
uniref:Uncharacterized protein n=1 Tax=Salarias fasciatus TaxID=181472 RepID=A0A672FQT7_SALFA